MMQPRVLVLIGSLDLGGAERQARLLVTRTPRERVRFHVACFGGEAEDLAGVRAAGVEIDLLPVGPGRLWPLRVLPRVRAIARRARIDVVQAFLPTFDILAPLLRPLLPGVAIVTSRRNVEEQLSARHLRLLRLTNGLAHAVVANSEAVARSVREREGVRAPRLRVIPNGIDAPPPVEARERADARRALALAEDDFAVAFLAHYREGKGHAYLPCVARRLLDEAPDARFLVAGGLEADASQQAIASRFRAELASLGLGDRVREVGLVRDTRPLLAAADAALNLSDVEGMSNAIMEAMSIGLPVVATDTGGARELIPSGREGIVVPAGDAGAASAALRDLARSPDLRSRIGRAARERIAREFSVERMVEAYARLYEELG